MGKPSISMGHLYHGYVTNNQRVHMYLVTLGIFEPMLCILFQEAIYACTGLYWARGIPICTEHTGFPVERSSDSHRIRSENEPKILDTKNALNGFKFFSVISLLKTK